MSLPAALLVAGVASAWWWPLSRGAAPVERLRLGLPLQPGSALVMIADAHGYFADAGLEVAVETFPSGRRALDEGLLPGRVEVASVSDVRAALAILHRQPLRILAELASATNGNRIVARRDRAVGSLADPRGKRLATQRDSEVDYFLHRVLVDQGIAADAVSLRYLSAEALAGALATGEVDAVAVREPFLSEAAQRLGADAMVLQAPRLYRQSELPVADGDWLARHPLSADRLLQALRRAERRAAAHPEEAIALVAERLGVTPFSIAQTLHGYRLQLPQSLVAALESQGHWLEALHPRVPKPFPDLLDYVVPQPLERVKPQAVTYLH